MSSEIQKQYQITSKIGNGNFSTVYLAKHITSQEIVAVKTMKNHIPIAIKQAQILKKMNHPNIIKLHQFEKPKHKEQVMIVLEYVPQNILELYEAQQYGLKEEQVKCILFQSCMGLYHIHKKGIIHRDIKPENIMINRSKAEVKIIDFGLAIEQDKCITDYVATRWYRAPENLLGTKEYTVSIDIFSLGCVIVELYLGNPLFPGANNIDQISKILSMIEQPTNHSWRKGYEMLIKLGLSFHPKNDKKKITLRTLLSSCSQGLTKLIEKMLVLNPFKRITAEEILRDPYFKDIEKIIPPHVYDRFLADFKPARSSMIKELPKPQKRNQSKQRIRFLSQQKSFGAFTSFKPHTPLNKFQMQFHKPKQPNPPEKAQSTKTLSFQKIIQDCGTCDPYNNLETTVFTKSRKSSFIKSQIIKDPSTSGQQNSGTGITDVSSSIKKSIEKYEKNILKLSTSLKNIKLLKSATQLQTQKPQESNQMSQNSDQLKQIKSTEMLSFRGFNQPKQKISMKQSGSTFLKKHSQLNEQKIESYPIKNKKVMEYLQKFQTIANHSQQFQRQKLQNSRSEPTIYQSVNGTPKKPHLLINTGTRPFGERQLYQNEQAQKNFTNNSFRLNLNQTTSFYHNQSSSNLMSQSFQRNHAQMNQSQNIRSADMLYSVSSEHQLRKSFEFQKPPMFQSPSPQRFSVQQPVIKFATFNQEQEMQSKFIPVQNSIHSSRVILEEPQNMVINSARSGQAYFNEPKSLNSSNYFTSSRNLMNSPQMNINPNRPIQNKIKLIAVRDNIPTNTHDISQTFMTTPNSSANVSRNPSYYQSSSAFIDKSRPNLTSNETLHSTEKEAHYIRSSQQLYPPEYQLKPNLGAESQQKTKQFKSLQHRQFYTKKTPSNRYSVNVSEDPPNIGYPKNYLSLNQNTLNNELKTNQQKIHQTTLSQLRESITGLSQSLNQGAFLSERSQKYNNKNININLNLNIYEKRSAKKR